MPKWMDKCVKSYKEQHPDDPDDKVWRICTAAYKKKFGHAPEQEDIIRPVLTALQERVGTESVQLTFSDDEKRELLQKAVHALYGEPDEYGYIPWRDTWHITAVYDSHIVVRHHELLYAISYTIVDIHTAVLGEPEEVVAAHVSAETEILNLLMSEGWLPKGTTQADLVDGDFAWLSFDGKSRKLPYKVHGEVSVEGWLSAWTMAQWTSYLRPDFSAGPNREFVMDELRDNMPDSVELDDDGQISIEEAVKDSVLFEGQLEDFLVEEATADEKDKFALVFSGNVIPQPNTEHGVWSVNQRLYTPEAVEATFDRSRKFLTEGGVATVYTSHAAAAYHSSRLPVGKVLSYSREGEALRFRGGIVGTAEGEDAIKLLEAGVLGTVSLRSYEWESHKEEVGDLGNVDVVDWCVIRGIDFATSPGLPGTQVTKEEVEQMDLTALTLMELKEARPDLVAELVAASPDVDAYELAVMKAANTGLASVVAEEIRARAKTVEEIPGVLSEARQAAVTNVYMQAQPAEPTNLKGSGDPAPEPPTEDASELTDSQKAIIENAGGKAA